MDAGSPPAKASVRECTLCPPWIAACAHLEVPGGRFPGELDEWIVLHKNVVGDWVICTGIGRQRFESDNLRAHEPGTFASLYVQERSHPDDPADDYDAALSAFHDAEAALLRGGDE